MIDALVSLLTIGQAEFTCLARNVYYESRNQPIEGQIAVAEVTLNRVEDPRWPDTVCGVVYQPHQFSWVGNTKGSPKEEEAWVKANAVAVIALIRPKRGDITYFHADYVKPYWAEKVKREVKIGNHIFYS